MTDRRKAESLLAACTVRLDAYDGPPRGTAFFVAPGYAMTAAHVVGGARGLPVQLHGRPGFWPGHVENVWPPADAGSPMSGQPYPPPDLALIRIDDGPAHMCALLSDRRPAGGAAVIARGHGRNFDGLTVTAETESFTLTGELETPDPDCTLLKLGLGQAVRGMSGAPVLDVSTGEVIGMLRTSRDIGSNLGAWVVPAELIRRLWPDDVRVGNERFHEEDDRWRRVRASMREQAPLTAPPASSGNVSIGAVHGGEVTVITGGVFRDLNIGADIAGRRRDPDGEGTR